MKKMHQAILSVGSNVDPEYHVYFSLKHISESLGLIQKRSRLYLTEPWGYHSENNFLNYVCIINTSLHPVRLLHEIKRIEKLAGRSKTTPISYEDRPLDIDILFYDDIIHMTPTLTIPHPYIHLRRFVLTPLMELVPQLEHPIFQLTIEKLHALCEDNKEVKPVEWSVV